MMISVIFVLMPLGGLYLLRVYESTLIRQTESELWAQAAFVAALYKHEILSSGSVGSSGAYGVPVARLSSPAHTVWNPIPVRLDLARDRIYPPRPQPQAPQGQLDATARQAGARMMPILKEAQTMTLSGIRVLDHQGLVAAGQSEVGLSFAQSEEFLRARLGDPVSLLRQRVTALQQVPLDSISRASRVNVFVALPVLHEGHLLGVVWLNRTPADLWSALYGRRMELTGMGLAILLAALLITALTALMVTRPVRGLVRQSRLIAEGHPDGLRPLAHPATRELAELADALTLMAEALQHRTAYLKHFTAHLSHEFKTPLTAIRGSVELLQDNLEQMSDVQRQRFLDNIVADAERLNRLVVRMMELARADLGTVAQSVSPVLVRPVLQAVQQRFAAQGLQVALPPAPDVLTTEPRVHLPADVLEAVLVNLLENSRQAGAGCVHFDFLDSGDASVLRLAVQDDGPGIRDVNRDAVFTPFFTTQREQGGTGLGLTISQALLERQGGRIVLAPTSRAGACFWLDLPCA